LAWHVKEYASKLGQYQALFYNEEEGRSEKFILLYRTKIFGAGPILMLLNM
jgi:hypothetical protein